MSMAWAHQCMRNFMQERIFDLRGIGTQAKLPGNADDLIAARAHAAAGAGVIENKPPAPQIVSGEQLIGGAGNLVQMRLALLAAIGGRLHLQVFIGNIPQLATALDAGAFRIHDGDGADMRPLAAGKKLHLIAGLKFKAPHLAAGIDALRRRLPVNLNDCDGDFELPAAAGDDEGGLFLDVSDKSPDALMPVLKTDRIADSDWKTRHRLQMRD